MTQKEIQMLIQLREFTIKSFQTIEGKENPLAMMRAQDTAYTLSSIVKSLDEILKSHVRIK